MKSLVLLTFLNLSPSAPPAPGPAEFFDDRSACESRMVELRQRHPGKDSIRCKCHETVEEVDAEGNHAI
jgi:hypothetical protein